MISGPPIFPRRGRRFPLGTTWDGAGVNFALWSEHATGAELCLFDSARADREVHRIAMGERTDQVWHAYVPGARPGLHYGYRLDGPYAPAAGHRYNRAKLLLDPYARAIAGAVTWGDALFDDRRADAEEAAAMPDDRDSAPDMPRSVVVDPALGWDNDRPPGSTGRPSPRTSGSSSSCGASFGCAGTTPSSAAAPSSRAGASRAAPSISHGCARPDGKEMTEPEWSNGFGRCLGLVLPGDAIGEMDDTGEPIAGDSFLVLLNAHHEGIAFVLPAHGAGVRWARVLDTQAWDTDDEGGELPAGATYPLGGARSPCSIW